MLRQGQKIQKKKDEYVMRSMELMLSETFANNFARPFDGFEGFTDYSSLKQAVSTNNQFISANQGSIIQTNSAGINTEATINKLTGTFNKFNTFKDSNPNFDKLDGELYGGGNGTLKDVDDQMGKINDDIDKLNAMKAGAGALSVDATKNKDSEANNETNTQLFRDVDAMRDKHIIHFATLAVVATLLSYVAYRNLK